MISLQMLAVLPKIRQVHHRIGEEGKVNCLTCGIVIGIEIGAVIIFLRFVPCLLLLFILQLGKRRQNEAKCRNTDDTQ